MRIFNFTRTNHAPICLQKNLKFSWLVDDPAFKTKQHVNKGLF